jgi:hypothetical protein
MPFLLATAALLGSLVTASKYLDSVAARVAPDLVSGKKPHQPVTLRSGAFLWLLLETLAAVLLIVLWIRGTLALRYVIATVGAIAFLVQFYILRLRPVFARGATPTERAALLLLSAAGALSLGCLLFWSARQGHAG